MSAYEFNPFQCPNCVLGRSSRLYCRKYLYHRLSAQGVESSRRDHQAIGGAGVSRCAVVVDWYQA